MSALRSGERQASETRFAWLVLAAYLPVALFAIAHHEMWRDELHCWLVARDSPWPWDVIRNRAYDGHPPLWYLVLWVLEKVTHDPRSMQALHVAIAASVVWVFARHAPFSRPLRALFPFGYFLAYEYVALSRCYGLAFLFALLVCVHHRRRVERRAVLALLLAALALTTTVATLLAAAYAIGLTADWIARARAGERRASRLWAPIAATGAAFLAAAACAWPPADSTVAHVGWPPHGPSDFALSRIVVGLFPLPRPDFFFWNSSLLLSFDAFERVAPLVALGLVAWIGGLFSSSRFVLVFFGAGVPLLLTLFGGVYGGDVRHHGFFFVLFVMGAWITALDAHEAPQATRPLGRWDRIRRFGLAPTLATVLLVHLPAAGIALWFDYQYVFSSGGRAARALKERGLEHSLLVAEMDYPATAVLGELGSAVAYSPRTGRPFSFVRWTRDRHWDPTDEQTLAYAAALGASRAEDAILLMNRPLSPELVDGSKVTNLAALYDSMIEEENFYIYRVARSETPFRTAADSGLVPPPRPGRLP